MKERELRCFERWPSKVEVRLVRVKSFDKMSSWQNDRAPKRPANYLRWSKLAMAVPKKVVWLNWLKTFTIFTNRVTPTSFSFWVHCNKIFFWVESQFLKRFKAWWRSYCNKLKCLALSILSTKVKYLQARVESPGVSPYGTPLLPKKWHFVEVTYSEIYSRLLL